VRTEAKEHPFGLFDEPLSAPVPVFFLEFRQLEIESAAVFLIVRQLALRFATRFSRPGFHSQCQPGLPDARGLVCLQRPLLRLLLESFTGLGAFFFQPAVQAEDGEQVAGDSLDGGQALPGAIGQPFARLGDSHQAGGLQS